MINHYLSENLFHEQDQYDVEVVHHKQDSILSQNLLSKHRLNVEEDFQLIFFRLMMDYYMFDHKIVQLILLVIRMIKHVTVKNEPIEFD